MKTQKLVIQDVFGETEQAVNILILNPAVAAANPHPKQLALKRFAAKTAIIQHHENKN